MSSKEACMMAKKDTMLGNVLTVAGGIIGAVLVLLLILPYFLPALYAAWVVVFLVYFGWIMGLAAVVLLAVGHSIKMKIARSCMMA